MNSSSCGSSSSGGSSSSINTNFLDIQGIDTWLTSFEGVFYREVGPRRLSMDMLPIQPQDQSTYLWDSEGSTNAILTMREYRNYHVALGDSLNLTQHGDYVVPPERILTRLQS